MLKYHFEFGREGEGDHVTNFRNSRLMMPNGSRSPSPLQRAQRKVTHRDHRRKDNSQRKTSTGILG